MAVAEGGKVHAIAKKLVTDEANRPVAVQIDYADWLAIARELRLEGDGARQVDLSRFAGTITLAEDPLEFQTRIRGEWS